MSQCVVPTFKKGAEFAAQGAEQLEPEAVLKLSTAQLRECGLSGQKAAYIQDIARRFCSGEFTTARIVGGTPTP